jgi:hypothetical protein
MLYYLIYKKADSKEIPIIKYTFSSKSEVDNFEEKIWKFLLSNVEKYLEEEMIDFYIGLVDQDCSKESSDDLTIKELKALKKIDLSEFIEFLEGSDENSSVDSYYLISEESRPYQMLNKMKLLKKDKKVEIIEIE